MSRVTGLETDADWSLSPLQYSRQEVEAVEELVPIRLEIEFEHYRLRDTFVWNVNGAPTYFAPGLELLAHNGSVTQILS